MGATTPKDRYAEALREARAIHAKGILGTDEMAQFTALTDEIDRLDQQIKTGERFAALDAASQASAGMLKLADGSHAEVSINPDPAGYTVVKRDMQSMGGTKARYGIEILDQYGEGVQSIKQAAALGSTAYRDAYKAYIRSKGRESAMGAGELKVLQEGIDTEGGLAA